jgi:hypothetical protein
MTPESGVSEIGLALVMYVFVVASSSGFHTGVTRRLHMPQASFYVRFT